MVRSWPGSSVAVFNETPKSLSVAPVIETDTSIGRLTATKPCGTPEATTIRSIRTASRS
jgi:hypothetical protein